MQDLHCTIKTKRFLAEGICDMLLSFPHAADVTPGQFVLLYCAEKDHLLPRPISVCAADAAAGTIRLVYRIVGHGTTAFSRLREGDSVEVFGPCGNGFPSLPATQRVLLVGGGIGIPPLLACAKAMPHSEAVLGYQGETFLADEFDALCPTYVATEDGRVGTKGNVLDVILEQNLTADAIFACGPLPMLRALKAYAAEKEMPAFLSLEERMACGTGACLGCVCKTKEIDAHSHTKRARVCKDGPVFLAEDLAL